jgi:hypothetical protein
MLGRIAISARAHGIRAPTGVCEARFAFKVCVVTQALESKDCCPYGDPEAPSGNGVYP